MKNYYEILEVNTKASKEVIEKAYRVLVKRYHPDMQSKDKKENAEKKLKDINEAYKILSDEFLREQYDVELQKEIEQKYRDKYTSKQQVSEEQIDDDRTEPNKKKKAKSKVGTLAGLIDLTKELYKNKPKREEFKEMTKKDITAILLTVVIMITIGIILWFIPFTNGWMRELIIDNPLFSWIWKIFSKA